MADLSPHEELRMLLRPAGGGIHVVSTGRLEQEALQLRLYGVSSVADVAKKHEEALARIPSAKAIVLGIPSDVGAGYLRGANMGPQGIRAASRHAANPQVVDIGDVFVVPQLLHDSMLSAEQLGATRASVHGGKALPVSPLSAAERILDLVFQLNPNVRPILLGGDHSCAWPAVASLAKVHHDWAILQIDAHTDLLPDRLGIKYCFATWSYHANDLIGRGGRLVQMGIRATRHERSHWESSLDVRQFWAHECKDDPEATLDAMVKHLRDLRVSGIYFSNDVDGTDETYVDATGTPEPDGLTPDFVVETLRRAAEVAPIIGGDVMEVAPPIARTPDGAARTLAIAARYFEETIAAVLRA